MCAAPKICCGTGTEPFIGSPLQSSSDQVATPSSVVSAFSPQNSSRTCSPLQARYGTLASCVAYPSLGTEPGDTTGGGTTAEAGLTATPATTAMVATAPSSIFLKLLKSCSSP